MKVGFFGGTFDPIHFGHLNLMIELKERCHLDHILLCPAYISPTREHVPPIASPADRLKMLFLAIEGMKDVSITELELMRPPPSYTIETLELLKKKDRGSKQFYLLLAEDSASQMNQWKEGEKLLELASPLVGTRYSYKKDLFSHLSDNMRFHIEKGCISIPILEISSTRVRKRLKNNLCCVHLIPAKVLDYIYENRLYYASTLN